MRKLDRLITLFLFLLTVNFSNTFAGVIEVPVMAEGVGATEDLAVRDALAKAVGKITGVSVSSDSVVKASAARASTVNGKTDVVRVTLSSERSSQMSANGQVKEWHKISSSKNEQGLYTIKVSAVIYRYELDASSSRKKIALLPAENRSSSSSHGKKAAADLLVAIENELVQSRRFAVLSRTDIDKVLDEQKIIGSDLTFASEKAKLGNMLGGDVLLLPVINRAYFTVKEEYIQVTGQTRKNYSGVADITLKVLSAVTGEIKFSGTYKASSTSQYGSLNKLLKEVSVKSVKDLVKRIYPARVVRVKGNQVFLNVGGDGVKQGEVFSVYRPGESMIDPYTGESLGSDEQLVGQIKLSRVESKFSIGEMISGEGFEANMIARSSGKPEIYRKRLKSVRTKPVSGYKLPFD